MPGGQRGITPIEDGTEGGTGRWERTNLFSTASTLRMSSQSSTALGCPSPPGQEESSRWWLVMHRVPFTAGCPAHDSSTLSTVAVLISSENSMAVLEAERGNPERRSPAGAPPPPRPSPQCSLPRPVRLVTSSLCRFLPAELRWFPPRRCRHRSGETEAESRGSGGCGCRDAVPGAGWGGWGHLRRLPPSHRLCSARREEEEEGRKRSRKKGGGGGGGGGGERLAQCPPAPPLPWIRGSGG